MPTVDDLGKSNYISKNDVGKGILLTIKSYEKKDVGIGRESIEWVFYFEEHEKGFIVKKTNGNLIAAVVGSADFDDWIGEKIVLYIDPTVDFQGKLIGGIRVRKPKNQPSNDVSPQPPEEDDIPF